MVPRASRSGLRGHRPVTPVEQWHYARALYYDEGATLDDLHKAVTILEDTERIARRVFGGTHPKVAKIELSLRKSRAALRARETPPAGDNRIDS